MVAAPLLIALPSGLIVSGVATWAVRLATGLASRGRTVGLILHAAPDGHARLDMDLHPSVRVCDLSHLPRFEDAAAMPQAQNDDVRAAWIDAYTQAARALSKGTGPVVLSPNLHADCYAVCVDVACRHPDLSRVIGWQHNDISYDRRVLEHNDTALAAIVGVSDHIVSMLRTLLPHRPINAVPYGVEIPAEPPRRPPLTASARHGATTRPIRLLYSGRLDHHQKRILALPHLSRRLVSMGIDHELTILGDGPARADLEREVGALEPASPCPPSTNAGPRTQAAYALARIHLLGPASPARVRQALLDHDAFILPSRFEGLSVAMLEALAAGCVPIVARVASGALQAIDDARTGLIAPIRPDADEAQTGAALAEQVARFLALNHAQISHAAWRSARDHFSIDAHLDRAAAVIDRAATAPPATWPQGRPLWFSDPGASIPVDAPLRLRRLLDSLGPRAIVIHAGGQHTRALLDTFFAGPTRVVAIADDDRQRQGSTLAGVPIIAPADASVTGATDVVISTHLHEPEVWARREVYFRQGLRVHRLYAPAADDRAACLSSALRVPLRDP